MAMLTYSLTHGQGMCTRWGGAVARRNASGVLGLRMRLGQGLRQGQVYIHTHMDMDMEMDLSRYTSLSMSRIADPSVQMRGLEVAVPGLLGYSDRAHGPEHRSQKAQGQCRVAGCLGQPPTARRIQRIAGAREGEPRAYRVAG